MSSKNTNKINVPEARAAMDKFKMEAAAEMGVNLKQGYNGDLTSREAGSVGGQMVKNLIESDEKPREVSAKKELLWKKEERTAVRSSLFSLDML